MPRLTNCILGILIVIPVTYCFVFVAAILCILVLDWKPTLEFIVALAAIHLSVFLLLLGLLTHGLIHIQRNSTLSAKRKRFWTVALILGNVVAIPIYWRHFIFHLNTTDDGG